MHKHSGAFGRIAATSAILIVLTVPRFVAAYDNTCYGTPGIKKWASSSVQVDVTDSSWPVGWSTLTANSMSAWNAVTPSNLSFSVGTSGTHKLKFINIGWFGNQGETSRTLSGNTITDIETVINSYSGNLWSTDGTPASNEFDVQAILTHELGHWACLDHVGGGTETMYSPIQPGSYSINYRSLEQDDKNGLNSLSY